MTYQPFIDDSEYIRVLLEVHRHVQGLIRQRFPAFPISSPAQAHVTLVVMVA